MGSAFFSADHKIIPYKFLVTTLYTFTKKKLKYFLNYTLILLISKLSKF